jgi:hypothetical protein
MGLSLVELMVGLVISIVLIGGIAQTMLASREAAVTRQSMSTITDNARFLFDFMARDLRMAGRGYCSADDDGCEADTWPGTTGNLAAPIIQAADSLTLRYESFDGGGDPIFVEVTFALNGNQVEYSRRTSSTFDANGRFVLPTADDGYSNEPLVAGISALDFQFGFYNRTAETYTFDDDITSGNLGDIAAIRTTATFVDLAPWAGQEVTVGNQGEIGFTVALRNRVARVTQ